MSSNIMKTVIGKHKTAAKKFHISIVTILKYILKHVLPMNLIITLFLLVPDWALISSHVLIIL